jgi:hypothetical protein
MLKPRKLCKEESINLSHLSVISRISPACPGNIARDQPLTKANSDPVSRRIFALSFLVFHFHPSPSSAAREIRAPNDGAAPSRAESCHRSLRSHPLSDRDHQFLVRAWPEFVVNLSSIELT